MAANEQISYSLVPYSCIFIDASWRNFFTAMLNCLHPSGSQKTEDDIRRNICREIASFFAAPSRDWPSLVCLSVRTTFDLFLRTKRFPAKSEIIMSAVNIPGMVDIVRHHGLIPVPWDIDTDTLSPTITTLDALITDRSVAIVLSHLFGKRCTIVEAAVRKAKEKGLYFIEDCAESFDVFGYVGHVDSDLVMFSFGVMKHFTAFGGAVCTVRDRSLYEEMEKVYSLDPVQSRRDYLKKLCTTLVAALGVNAPLIMHLGVPVANLIRVDYKARVVEMLRGFPPGADLWRRLRQRPSVPLLLMLRQRLSTVTADDLRKTKEKGQFVRRLLPDEGVKVPGRLANQGHDWLFPIIVDDPDAVAKRLNAMGVDAVTKATQLTVVNRSGSLGTGRTGSTTKGADYLLDHVVYLPVHKNVPYAYLRKICKAVEVAVKASEMPKGPVIRKSKL